MFKAHFLLRSLQHQFLGLLRNDGLQEIILNGCVLIEIKNGETFPTDTVLDIWSEAFPKKKKKRKKEILCPAGQKLQSHFHKYFYIKNFHRK